MENPEIKSSAEPTVRQLQEQVDSLRHLVISLLVLSIVVSGTLTLYLLRQSKYARMEAANMRGSINEFSNTNLPVIRDFRNRLLEYSKTHPDFAPVARKYGIVEGPMTAAPGPSGVVPTGGASPAAAPKPKK